MSNVYSSQICTTILLGKGAKEMVTPLLRIIREYCRETSMHGLSYMISERRNKVAFLGWVSGVAFCLGAAIMFSNDNMSYWKKSPSMVTFAGTQPLEDVALKWPMINVCPERRISFIDLVESYFIKYEDEARELPIADFVKTGLAKKVVKEMRTMNFKVGKANPSVDPFKEECYDSNPQNNTKCDFLNLLHSIHKKRYYYHLCNDLEYREVLVDFVVKMTLQEMR